MGHKASLNYRQQLLLDVEKLQLSTEEMAKAGYPTSEWIKDNKGGWDERKLASKDRLKGIANLCSRCGDWFHYYYETNDSREPTKDSCVHHWGKKINSKKYPGLMWSCCNSATFWDAMYPGCTTHDYHVTQHSENPTGFVATIPTWGKPLNVYSIDCEMVYTTVGVEVARVSILRSDGEVVLNTLVKPTYPIVDYATRISGITADMLANVTKTPEDVREEVLAIVHAKSILVGHSLENDLKCLKLLHDNVVDTAVLYPHAKGLPLRRSLKALAKEHLNMEIQTGDRGHDSLQDAEAALQLVLKKLGHDRLKYYKEYREFMGSPVPNPPEKDWV